MFTIYTINEISKLTGASNQQIRDYINRNSDLFKSHKQKQSVILIDDEGLTIIKNHFEVSEEVNPESIINSQEFLQEKEIEIKNLKNKLKEKEAYIVTLDGAIFSMKKCAEEIVKENNYLKEKLKKFNNFERVVEDTCKKSATLLHQAGEEIDNLREENYHLKLLLELILSN